MKTSLFFLVANWKMNPETLEEAKKIFLGIRREASQARGVTTIICPPFIYLSTLQKLQGRRSKKIFLGVQDVFFESQKGSFTGEISVPQVKNMGVQYALIGHSERRALGETDETINKKVIAAVRFGITPILCVGELSRDKEGNFLGFIESQLVQGLRGISKKQAARIFIAYEPVYAIGKSEADAPTGAVIHETVIFIRKILSNLFGQELSMRIPILYGGSVGILNAAGIIEEGQTQGLLIGHESLDPGDFSQILEEVSKK